MEKGRPSGASSNWSIFARKDVSDHDFSINAVEYAEMEKKFACFFRLQKKSDWHLKLSHPGLESSLMSYIFHNQMESAKRAIDPSFLAILCDAKGVIAALSCSEDVMARISDTGLNVGASLSLPYAGINAVSAAMELNRPVFIRHTEHSLSVFHDWACVCIPVTDKANQVIGYFDISTYCSVAVQRYYPLCLHIAEAIGNYQTLEQYISEKIDGLALTKRQKEICWYWVHDYDYKSIGSKLFISPHTVRVIVSQIYEFMSVTSRSSLILKILEGYHL